jgi:hypothetical protein
LAVLESHHAATLFFILDEEKCNIFDKFTKEEYNKMRKYLIDNILYTDMAKHGQMLADIK